MICEESCRIVTRHRKEGVVSDREWFWYEAVVEDSTGRRVVARSKEWPFETPGLIEAEALEAIRKRDAQRDTQSRTEVVNALLADGWQLAGLNDKGLPSTFRRLTTSTAPGAIKLDVALLLKDLDDLHQAGLLTEEEYAAKKGELLKRTS